MSFLLLIHGSKFCVRATIRFEGSLRNILHPKTRKETAPASSSLGQLGRRLGLPPSAATLPRPPRRRRRRPPAGPRRLRGLSTSFLLQPFSQARYCLSARDDHGGFALHFLAVLEVPVRSGAAPPLGAQVRVPAWARTYRRDQAAGSDEGVDLGL